MKTRIVAGLVASLALLTSLAADAAPKKHGGKHAAKHATAAPAPATKPAAVKPAKPASPAVTAPTAKPKGETKPASLVTAPASPRHGKKKHKHHAAAATQPASLVTTTPSPRKHHPRHATQPASLITPEPEALPSSEPAAKPTARGGHHAKLVAPKASRFLASGVPLAETNDGRIQAVGSAKHPCGSKSRWAKKNSAWTALDEWGQTVPNGGAQIADSRFYDGSGCYEVQLKTACTRDDAGRLYVANGSGYVAGTSAQWNADAAVAKRFDRLYAAQDSAWVDGHASSAAAKDTASAKSEEPGRTLFFSLPKQDGSVEGAATQRRPTHWAVAGGRVLVVGYVSANGVWKVGHVLPPNGKEHAYEPLAILDMNGDGLPEIVVHEEAGGVYVDRVLSFDPGTMRWEKAVESPGGATN